MSTTIQRPARRSSPRLESGAHPRALDGKFDGKLVLGALGVVFGDIGTSPLYALKECLQGEHSVGTAPADVLGILSLIFWALTLVVSIKYLTFIMRADNHGEGGILALLALVPAKKNPDRRAGAGFVTLLVLFGAALLYGDGVITPAVSVLSAMEGLEIATTALKPAVIPLTVATLLALFLVQKRGTEGIGKVFGPVTLAWFLSIAVLGIVQLVRHPAVLLAVDPRHAVWFMLRHGTHGFLILGAVVLSITGAEALYADMGHFGRAPIRTAWFALVFPSLLLNYFGQGALVLENPNLQVNPFYALVPGWALYPMVFLATAATVVASQALISGAFSLTQQAVQLGFFPRVSIIHTSKDTEGQIYIPEINQFLMVACVGLAIGFKSSSALANAYGIAVTGTMGITSVVYYVVARERWKWPLWKVAPLAFAFLAIDLTFFASTATKILEGGWFPILMGIVIYTVMTTWATGRRYLAAALADAMLPLDLFMAEVSRSPPVRVRGTAVFMASNAHGVPPILLHHFKHNQCLHDNVVLLTVNPVHVPTVSEADALQVEPLSEGFFRVTLRYGFMDTPDVPRALAMCAAQGLVIDRARTSYYLGRETLLPTGKAPMWRWRKTLFAFVSRNARPATSYFGLPPNRVVELGMQLDF